MGYGLKPHRFAMRVMKRPSREPVHDGDGDDADGDGTDGSYQEKLALATQLADGDAVLAERALNLRQVDKNRWKDKQEGGEIPIEVKQEWEQLGKLGHGRNKKLNLG